MRQKPEKGVYSNRNNRPDMDCTVCINRKGCNRAQEGTFCTGFQSKEFDPKGKDPNELWELWKKGEEVEF